MSRFTSSAPKIVPDNSAYAQAREGESGRRCTKRLQMKTTAAAKVTRRENFRAPASTLGEMRLFPYYRLSLERLEAISEKSEEFS